MSGNTFGQFFQAHTFGESHGPAMGVVIDGCPSGLLFDEELLRKNLARRRPGQSSVTTARQEADEPEILSGVFEGKTLGTPIAVVVRNLDARPADYRHLQSQPRPGHADDLWLQKFGHADGRGGGRASGRETLSRVIAGSFAQMLVRDQSPGTEVVGWAESIGPVTLDPDVATAALSADDVDRFSTRLPEAASDAAAQELLRRSREQGESHGGVVRLCVRRPPHSLGRPVFGKIKALWAQALLSVGATAGIQIGDDFDVATTGGRTFHAPGIASPYGGIRGGLSTGETLSARITFKPTSTVGAAAIAGRHDPCILPRAIPVLESMTYWLLADLLLARRLDQL